MLVQIELTQEAIRQIAKAVAEHQAAATSAPAPQPAPQPATVETPAPVAAEPAPPTIEDVRNALAAIPRDKAIGLLSMFGAGKLSDLPADKYAEILGMVG